MNEEAKNPPNVEEAKAQLAAAVANEEAAVLTHEKAGEDLEAATSACVLAPSGKLDACISAKIRAREKLGILAERLSVARERSGFAAVALRAAELVELEAEAERARIALAEADESIQVTIPALVEKLLACWTEARAAHKHASSTASTAAKAKGVPATEGRGIIAAHTKTDHQGNVDAVASTASLVAWLAAAPKRAAEKRIHEEQKVADRARRALQGDFGPEEQDAARIAARDFMVSHGAKVTFSYSPRAPRFAPIVNAPDVPDSEQDLYARGAIASRAIAPPEAS